MQPIRTLAEIPVEFSVITQEPFLYQQISQKAQKRYRLGMNFHQVGKALKVDEKTAKKAIEFQVS